MPQLLPVALICFKTAAHSDCYANYKNIAASVFERIGRICFSLKWKKFLLEKKSTVHTDGEYVEPMSMLACCSIPVVSSILNTAVLKKSDSGIS